MLQNFACSKLHVHGNRHCCYILNAVTWKFCCCCGAAGYRLTFNRYLTFREMWHILYKTDGYEVWRYWRRCGGDSFWNTIWIIGSRCSISFHYALELELWTKIYDRGHPFSCAFAKLRKATVSFVLSVRPHVTSRLPLDGFSWNLSIFRKI